MQAAFSQAMSPATSRSLSLPSARNSKTTSQRALTMKLWNRDILQSLGPGSPNLWIQQRPTKSQSAHKSALYRGSCWSSHEKYNHSSVRVPDMSRCKSKWTVGSTNLVKEAYNELTILESMQPGSRTACGLMARNPLGTRKSNTP